jgi:hypothetical protein
MTSFRKLLIVMLLLLASQTSITAQSVELSDGDRIRTFGSVVQLIINEGTDDEELGTGFVVDQSGIILTNAHVVANVDMDDPDIKVGIFESTIAVPNTAFQARVLEVSDTLLIDYEVDVAVLELYDFIDGAYDGSFDDIEEDDFEVSLTTINAWNPDSEEADSIYLFGYPNFSVNLPTSVPGSLTAFLRNGNIASDVPFGEAGSGGPAINANNQMIGVAQARDAGGDYTSIISIGTICDAMSEICDLLPELPDEDEPEGDISRRVGDDGFLQCLNARGPSFERGDSFVVPFSGGGTYMRNTPSWVSNNRSTLLEEGEGGTIVAGPVCGPAAKGELIGWFVETDDGETGWMSEGYIFNIIPWISVPEDAEEWVDYAPEDFECFSYGPNFQVGDEFIVPLGDGPTGLYQFPNQQYSGVSIPEREGGIILEGPECAGGSRGLLTSWRVLADNGTSGWVSEGYSGSPAPWIAPVLDND